MLGERTSEGSLRTLLGRLEPLLLFVAVLNLPKVSTAAAFGLFAGRFVWWTRSARAHARLAPRLLLLSSFALSYYIIWLSYGFGDFDTARKSVVLIVGFYAVGYAVGGGDAQRETRLVWAAFAIAAGLVTFASLSVLKGLDGGADVIGIAERAVPSVWSAEELINGPGLGAFSSLGMCLLPAFLLSGQSPEPSRWARRVWKVLALSLALAGTYTNMELQNRTPVLALATATIACGVFAFWTRRGTGRFVTVFVALAVALGAYALATSDLITSQSMLYGRFQERGLTTERYGAWAAMAQGMFSHPGGGRIVDIGGLHYVHNLWLDLAYDAGVLPIALLVAFHLSHVGCMWRVLRSSAPSFLSFVLLGLGVSYMATFVVEPALQFSVVYFATSGFFLGLVLRRDEALRTQSIEEMAPQPQALVARSAISAPQPSIRA